MPIIIDMNNFFNLTEIIKLLIDISFSVDMTDITQITCWNKEKKFYHVDWCLHFYPHHKRLKSD